MNKSKVFNLYQQGWTPSEIIDELGLDVSTRTIQRWLKTEGIIRPHSESQKYRRSTDTFQRTSPGYLYFVENGRGVCKLGITINLERRLKEFATNSGIEMTVIASNYLENPYEIEQPLHTYLRTSGVPKTAGEWYDFNPFNERSEYYYFVISEINGNK